MDDVVQRLYGPDTVMAEIHSKGGESKQWKISDVPIAEKLEKFVEDVRYVMINFFFIIISKNIGTIT